MIEYKSFASFEIKSEAEGVIEGYAATWARDSDGDRFEAGAFAASVKEKKGKVPIFLHHDRMQWAGVSTALSEDHKGLWIEAKMFLDTTIGRDAWGTIKGARAADFPVGLSVGFISLDVDYDDAARTRVIKAADLWETSITPFPANKQARIEEAKTQALRNYERLTRDVCKCSAAEAKRLVAMLPLAVSVDADTRRLTPARDVRGMKRTEEGGRLAESIRAFKESMHV